ncbi:MAG: COX15/CtaA family protein, partial [Pseudomonadota bacterium]
AVVIAQGTLGMLTVTLLLKPAIVLAHLLGGMLTLALLGWMTLTVLRRGSPAARAGPALRALALAGLAAVTVQIALGGWTSTNYAALACPDIPQCQGQWWPDMDFGEGFTVWRGLGVDYEGGVLDNPSRTAIHLVHRLGAIVVTIVLLTLIATAWREPRCRGPALAIAAALATQVGIGVAIVVQSLPLGLATAHNGVAAALLLAVLNLNHLLHHGRNR